MMKQMLLRVPDDVHRRLADRAARDGRSVNSVATEILDAAVDADQGDRQARLRARALALGLLRPVLMNAVSPLDRVAIIAATEGTGPVVDRSLIEDRGPG